MNLIFQPRINFLVRHALKPFASFLPVRLHPRINGTITVDLDEGHWIAIDCNPTSFQCKVLFFQGIRSYEYTSIKVLMHLARHTEVFLDVGANIGLYSLIAATVNPDMQVHSFEPLPSAYEYLNRNVRLNELTNIRTWKLAASNEQGEQTFYYSKDPSFPDVEHHLTSTGGFSKKLSSRTSLVEPFPVQTETLDHFVTSELPGKRVGLLKLDTEASEHLVLQGAENLLTHHRPIIFCEVLPDQVGDEVAEICRRHGYLMFEALDERLWPVEELRPGNDEHKEHLFVHPDWLSHVQSFIG